MTLTPSQAAALKWLVKREWRALWRFSSRLRSLTYTQQRDIMFHYDERHHVWWGWQVRITPLGLAALREWEERQNG